MPGTFTAEHKAKISQALMGHQYTDKPKYGARHYRVRVARGSASTHLCEGGCQGKAHDWALIHDRDGMNVSDYVPLCRHCHQLYDGIQAYKGRGGR